MTSHFGTECGKRFALVLFTTVFAHLGCGDSTAVVAPDDTATVDTANDHGGDEVGTQADILDTDSSQPSPTACDEHQCGPGGYCVLINAVARCACLAGYQEQNAYCVPTVADDPCQDISCSDHGTCRVLDPAKGWFHCDCEEGYAPFGNACLETGVGQQDCVPFQVSEGTWVCLDATDPADSGFGLSFATEPQLPGASLPERVDHKPRHDGCAQVKDQGRCGWCTSFATSAMLDSIQCEDGLTSPVLSSPASIRHNDDPELAQTCGRGQNISRAVTAVATTWVLEYSDWPYPTECTQTDTCALPGHPDNVDGVLRGGLQAFAVASQSVSALKQALADGFDVVYSLPVFGTLETGYVAGWRSGSNVPVDLPPSDADIRGYHAILIIGYDDSTAQFQFKNSWGSDWPTSDAGGFGWATYAFVGEYGRGGAYIKAVSLRGDTCDLSCSAAQPVCMGAGSNSRCVQCATTSDCPSGMVCNGEFRCDSRTCFDSDGDGFGRLGASDCSNHGVDCDDSNRAVNPAAAEICDDVDNDCDSHTDESPECEAAEECVPPCVNGTCGVTRECQCIAGYTGDTCAEPVCTAACLNGGGCIAPDTCDCSDTGYSGTRCEAPVCNSTCLNGGDCIAPDTCDCIGTGFSGDRCEIPEAVCSEPCLNGGVCTEAGTCGCDGTGYSGIKCQTPICAPMCQNGGACIAPNTCECAGTGYHGPLCEDPDPSDFVRVPAGTFMMGKQPDGEPTGCSGETPQHEVTLTRAFWLKATEVTIADWRALMGDQVGSLGNTDCGDQCPVARVTWWEALAYANALSSAQGLQTCYELVGCQGTLGSGAFYCENMVFPAGPGCTGYRLPTEAEWEYSARAGTTTATYNGNLTTDDCSWDDTLAEIAWYCGNAGGVVRPVAGRVPNAWGLFDTLGNVAEWTHDARRVYSGDPVTNPLTNGTNGGVERMIRGGSYYDDAEHARAANRCPWPSGGNRIMPNRALPHVGFRVARTIP